MRRLAWLLGVATLLGGSAHALAQPRAPEAGAEGAAAAALEAAEARQRAAGQQLAAAQSATRRREEEAKAAALAEVERRRGQVAAVEAAEREVVALLDRIEAAQRPSDRLLLELVVLERWHTDLQPVVANLTPRSFLGLERELSALAQAGRIESGPVRVANYAALGRLIGELGRLLAARRAAGDRERAALRTLKPHSEAPRLQR